MFKVIGTASYLSEINKWSKMDKFIANKIPKQLAINPFVGDPLGYRFLREKRVSGKRVYYLVYEDLELVLLVATSAKKDQQATINHVKSQLDEYRQVAEEVIKQGV